MGPLTKRLIGKPLRTVRRLAIFLVGGTVLLIGVAMIVLPGPAFIVIPTGLAILSVEFLWARNLLTKARSYLVSLGKGRGNGK